jgi:hypothetical protein
VKLLLQDVLDPDPECSEPDAEADARVYAAFLKDVVDPLERLASGGVRGCCSRAESTAVSEQSAVITTT